ncbi:MAG: xylulokinase [Spirochaetota bacterium]
MRQAYLCVDAGTTRFKAALITSRGRLLAQEDRAYRAAPGSASIHEYDPEEFVQALAATAHGLLGRAGVEITAVGITGHGPTLIPVGREGGALHPAVGYLDDRVRPFIRRLARQSTDHISSTMYLPIALFFKEKLPRVYRRTRVFLQGFDYLAFRLTGEAAASSSTRGLRPWVRERIEEAGLEGSLFPPVRFMGERIGVTGKEALDFGIPRGVPVVAVGVDFAAALIGTGALERGKSCERAGSSGGINLCWDREIADNRLLCYRHFMPGMWNVAGITSTYGKAIDWARELAGPGAALSAGGRPAACLFLPYLKGERSPLWNPDARGMLAGVAQGPLPPGYVLQAACQGIAFSIRNCIELMEQAGCRFSGPIVSTGGAAGGGRFLQLKADAVGKPFALTGVRDAELPGIAMVLAVSEGRFPDVGAAARELVKPGRVYHPREKHTRVFDRLYEQYLRVQATLIPFFEERAGD